MNEEVTYYVEEPWDISLFTGTHELSVLLKDSDVVVSEYNRDIFVQEVS